MIQRTRGVYAVGFASRQFDAREDLDHRAVVFACKTCGGRLHEHLVCGRRQRQRELAGARHVQYQTQIFYEDVNGRQRRVIGRQHMGHAVLEHPAVAGAVGDDLVQRRRIDTFAQTQGHGLGGSGDVHAGEQLVDDLDLAAGAGAIAELVDLASHGIEHGLGLGVGFGGAGGHHRHFTIGGLGGAAGNGRVDVQQTLVGKALFQRDRPIGVYRGAHHENGSRSHGRGTAVGTEKHLFGLLRIDHDRHHDVTACGQVGG